MAKRGRPRHPDILTPREWEVLALLREELSNEQIAQRLDITERTAKYHVSEILSKLGVPTREDAARWQPEAHRPWWAAAFAPLGLLWRRGSPALSAGLSTLALALSVGVLAMALAAAGVVAFVLLRDDDGATLGAPNGDGAVIARLAFSAGGSIYTVNVDGTDLREIIPGDRDTKWNASPAFSPDGSTIAFTRNFNVWVADADGTGARLLADVAELATPPAGAASNPSVGVQSVAWSPDGEHLAYVLGRIGASAIQEVWVMRADGSERARVYQNSVTWLLPSWLDNERIAIAELAERVRVFRLTGEEESSIALPDPIDSALTAVRAPAGDWLVGPFISEGPIRYGNPPALQEVASGVSPALSPDGGWFAYFDGDALRIASVDGAVDEPVIDLAPLGGRDRDFVEGCVPETSPGCPYRVPTISWAGPEPTADRVGASSVPTSAGPSPEPNAYFADHVGIRFNYPASWIEDAAEAPFRGCTECTVFGPTQVSAPYGVRFMFGSLIGDGCGPGCYVPGIGRSQESAERTISVATRQARQVDIKASPPLGYSNETGDVTPYHEVWTLIPFDDQVTLRFVAFYRDGDTAAEAATLAAYDMILSSLRID
ncbi:MAG: LuxR C-terminal-related transcriptional regulator [Dehalococcoidia bacterium]